MRKKQIFSIFAFAIFFRGFADQSVSFNEKYEEKIMANHNEVKIVYNNSYTLGDNENSSNRLDLQHTILGRDFKNHLLEIGLKKDMLVLEIGCGNGLMALWTASQVGEQGKVIAIDCSQKHINIARQRSEALGIKNIEFICCDVRDLDLPSNSIDLIYCRFLLMHLTQPLQVVKQLTSFLKPEGAFAAQEPINSNTYIYPHNKMVIKKLVKHLKDIAQHYKVDYDIGEKLHKIFCQAGLHRVSLYFSQRVIPISQMKTFLLQFYDDISAASLNAGVISLDELSKQITSLQRYPESEDDYFVLPQQAHVSGYKSDKIFGD